MGEGPHRPPSPITDSDGRAAEPHFDLPVRQPPARAEGKRPQVVHRVEGYGSQEWLEEPVRRPAHRLHHRKYTAGAEIFPEVPHGRDLGRAMCCGFLARRGLYWRPSSLFVW